MEPQGKIDGTCPGDHAFFVADVAVVIPEGKVVVLALCTGCGTSIARSHKVSEPWTEIALEKEKERQRK